MSSDFSRDLSRRQFAAAGFLGLAASRIATSQDAPKLTHVRVSLGDVSLNKVPFLIADDAGIYRRYGLEVQQLITPGAAAAVRASGINVPERYIAPANDRTPSDLSISGAAPTINGMVSGNRPVDRVILATTDTEVRWKIIATPAIKTLGDLKGKRLGYSGRGTVSHFMALAFAQKVGWQLDKDITLVGGGIGIATLQENKADAIIADEIVQALAPAAGFHAVVDLRQYHIPLAGSSVVASRTWLASHRDVALQFLRATIESIALMKRDSAVTGAAMAKWFAITNPAEQKRIWAEASDLPMKPYPSREGIAKLIELYDSPEMKKHKPEDFYDDSLIREIDKSGFIDRIYTGKAA